MKKKQLQTFMELVTVALEAARDLVLNVKKQVEKVSRKQETFESYLSFLVDEAGYCQILVTDIDYRENYHLYAGYFRIGTSEDGRHILVIKKDKVTPKKK